MDHNDSDDRAGFVASRANLVLLGFLAIGGYFLVTEHWAHIVPSLPWLFLLACPLMHVFMHGGDSGHGGGGGDGGGSAGSGDNKPHQH
jgi:hypothetical protein